MTHTPAAVPFGACLVSPSLNTPHAEAANARDGGQSAGSSRKRDLGCGFMTSPLTPAISCSRARAASSHAWRGRGRVEEPHTLSGTRRRCRRRPGARQEDGEAVVLLDASTTKPSTVFVVEETNAGGAGSWSLEKPPRRTWRSGRTGSWRGRRFSSVPATRRPGADRANAPSAISATTSSADARARSPRFRTAAFGTDVRPGQNLHDQAERLQARKAVAHSGSVGDPSTSSCGNDSCPGLPFETRFGGGVRRDHFSSPT